MKELMTEWRKFINERVKPSEFYPKEFDKFLELIKEQDDALDLPGSGPKHTDVNIPSIPKAKFKDFQIYPNLRMDKDDQHNIMEIFLKYDEDQIQYSDNREENFRRIYRAAYTNLISSTLQEFAEAKKRAYAQATTPQSLDAYRKLAYEKKLGLRKIGLGSNYHKPWTKETADDLVNAIPEQLKRALEQTSLYISFSSIHTGEAAKADAFYVEPNIFINSDKFITFSREKRIETLIHELGHHFDFYIGNFIYDNNPELRGSGTFSLSGRVINQDEFIKSFLKPEAVASLSSHRYNQYLVRGPEIYTRIKKLQRMLSSNTGFVNFKMLKDFIQNEDPNKYKENRDVEYLMNILDFSTDQKIKDFVNFMNRIANAEAQQDKIVAEAKLRQCFRKFL